jgi:hypothetical protein
MCSQNHSTHWTAYKSLKPGQTAPRHRAISRAGVGQRREGFLEETMLGPNFKGTATEPQGREEIGKAHKKRSRSLSARWIGVLMRI